MRKNSFSLGRAVGGSGSTRGSDGSGIVSVRYRLRNLKNMTRAQGAGFSIVQVLMASALMGLVALGVASLMRSAQKGQAQSNVAFHADMTRRSLGAVLSHPDAWAKTAADPRNSRASSSALDCLASGTPCTEDGADLGAGGKPVQNYPVNVVLDASGGVVFDASSPSKGVSAQGVPCDGFKAPPASGNDACPLRFEIAWSALCGASCVGPQIKIQVKAVYNPGSIEARASINPANYGIAAIYQGSGVNENIASQICSYFEGTYSKSTGRCLNGWLRAWHRPFSAPPTEACSELRHVGRMVVVGGGKLKSGGYALGYMYVCQHGSANNLQWTLVSHGLGGGVKNPTEPYPDDNYPDDQY